MSYRHHRDWRYERDDRSYGHRDDRRDWRNEPARHYDRDYASRFKPRSSWRENRGYEPSSIASRNSQDRYDRDRSYPHTPSSSSNARTGYREDRQREQDRRPEQSKKSLADEGGIKDRDVGYALLSREERSYVRRSLRGQLRPEEKISEGGTTPGSTEPSPRQIVEEFKRAGHFDAIRKQLFLAFQSSKQKEDFVGSLDKLLLQRLEGLSTSRRQRLAAQDKRLQHSELTRWIEEDRAAGDAFKDLFSALRKTGGLDDTTSADSSGLLNAGGKLALDIDARLKELIQAQHRRLDSTLATSDSEEEDDDGESASTPALKSSVTPMGQETPRRHGGLGSAGTGNGTPALTYKNH